MSQTMNARRKIVVAMMMHETNTFSPVPTPLVSFRPLSGQAAIEEFRDTNTQLGGFLNPAHEIGAEIIVPLAAGAHPSGYVEAVRPDQVAPAFPRGLRAHRQAHRDVRRRRLHQLRSAHLHLQEPPQAALSLRGRVKRSTERILTMRA